MLTLSDALNAIAPEALPADENYQVPWINAVCSTLIAGGKWAGTTLKWRGSSTSVNFAIQQDVYGQYYLTLPPRLLCILAAGFGDDSSQTNDNPLRFSTRPIRGAWHEFGNSGSGVGDVLGSGGLQDLGEYFTTFRDFTEPSYLRVKTSTAEATDATMLFRGLDENEEEIFTGSGASTINGVELDISTALTTTTTQQFSGPRPTLIQKPVTRGQVRLYAVSVASGTETLIGIYDPYEMSPSYRRYGIAPCCTVTTVHAMCKRRHVNAVAMADTLIPDSVQAIEHALMGRRYDLANNTKTALDYWSRAFAQLNSELGEVQGSTTARFQFERGFGLGGIAAVH